MLGVYGAAALSLASAAPVLPSADLASAALRSALSVEAAPAVPVAMIAAKSVAARPDPAAEARAKGVAAAQKTQKVAVRVGGKSAVVRATAYNSAPNQTDSTPFITATGTRTHFGVVALSRDLLAKFPYGTKLKIEDLSGRYQNLLAGQVFIVEDTMHPRKRGTVDVWMTTRGQALSWGARSVRITELR